MPVDSCPTRRTTRKLPARRHLCGQNHQGSKACRPAGGAADKVRAGDKSQDREADWADNSAGGARPGDQVDQVKTDKARNYVARME